MRLLIMLFFCGKKNYVDNNHYDVMNAVDEAYCSNYKSKNHITILFFNSFYIPLLLLSKNTDKLK